MPHRRRWILHFDVNETILVGDPAGGDTPDDSLNKLLAKSAFCRIPQDALENISAIKTNNENDGESSTKTNGDDHNNGNTNISLQQKDFDWSRTRQWEPTEWWDGTPIGMEPLQVAQIPDLWTKWAWPPQSVPYYRTGYKSRAKTFIHHHGAIYRPIYEKLRNEMLSRTSSSSDPSQTIIPLLPAFFDTLVELNQRNVDYAIVFRTFGTDLPAVAAAVTEFATGKHPNYPDFHDETLVLSADDLWKGGWALSPNNEVANINEQRSAGPDQSFVYELKSNSGGERVVASGDDEVLQKLENPKRRIFGIQDDYSFWKQHGFQPWAGKPVWVGHAPIRRRSEDWTGCWDIPEMSDETRMNDGVSHHILFDDNIHNLPDDGIAGLRYRDSTTGHFVSATDGPRLAAHGTHLVRVPTVEPLLNRRWFVAQLEGAAQRVGCTLPR